MEEIMGFLLGSLGLFYPLFVSSVVTLGFGLIKRSWFWMLVSTIVLFPIAWYFGSTPAFSWAKFIPLIQIILAIIFYQMKKNKDEHLNNY